VHLVFPGGEPTLAAFFDGELGPRLRALGTLTVHRDQPDPHTAAQRLRDADVGLLASHLAADDLPMLAGRTRLLAFAGTGAATYVDLAAARAAGITVTNVTGYGDRAVAELALALLLGAARGVPAGDVAVRTGDWSGWAGRELFGSTVGVVGLGSVGGVFARLASALGMRVLAHDARPVADLAAMAGPDARLAGLDELLAEADAVSLHLPLTEATRGVLDARRIGLLRPGAILVNTARAELVDHEALVARLAGGDLVYATDVFAPEPLPAGDPLLAAPATVFTPHIGYRTPQAMRRMAAGVVECVEAFCAGSPIRVVS
jgi:D-3-phosphoglycerate dehydrogenase